LKQKFCDVPVECVITRQDASIYEAPLSLRGKDWRNKRWIYCSRTTPVTDLTQWQTLVVRIARHTGLRLGLSVNMQLGDAYLGYCGSAAPCRDRYGWRPFTCAGSILEDPETEELNVI